MRFADFFSGIGGFRLGLERSGHKCVYSCEIDDFCREVQHERFGREPEGGDINEVRASDIPDADLWCGGFPCQGNSTAGQRKGLADPRSGLIGRFLDLVGEKKPTWLFLENVPGLLSVNKGEDWQTIFRRMAELGYVGAWRILDAQYLGVPQRRRRVFVVARCLAAAGPDPSEILFEPEGVLGSAAKSVSARSRAAAGTQGGTGISVAGTLQSHHPRNAPDDALCVVGGVYQCHGGNVGPLGAERRGNGGLTGGVPFVAAVGHETGHGWWKQDSTRSGTLRVGGERPSSPSHIVVAHTLRCTSGAHPGARGDGCDNLIVGPVIANTVQASAGHHGHSSPRGDGSDNLVVAPESPYIIEPESGQGTDIRARPCNGISPAIAATDGAKKTDRGLRLVSRRGVRRLLPIECERLQGLPDGWTGIEESSDAKRYRAIGNAVAVPVIEWIGRRFRDTH